MPRKGYKQSEEHRLNSSLGHMGQVRGEVSEETRTKISNSLKGRSMLPEVKEKLLAANLGKKHSAETRAKMSASHRAREISPEARERMAAPNRGKVLSPEHLAKLSIAVTAANTGRKLSEEHKEALKNGRRGQKITPENKAKLIASITGRKWTPEMRAHHSEVHRLYGPRTRPTSYPIEWTEELRETIRKRDNRICRKCGTPENRRGPLGKRLHVHHINHDKYDLCHTNLISLCMGCHKGIHTKDINWWKIEFAFIVQKTYELQKLDIHSILPLGQGPEYAESNDITTTNI